MSATAAAAEEAGVGAVTDALVAAAAALPLDGASADADADAEGATAAGGPLLLAAILKGAPGTNSAADRDGTNGAALLVSERERGAADAVGEEKAAAVGAFPWPAAERKDGMAEGNADGAPIAAAPSRLSRLDGGGEWCSGGVR